MVTENGSSCSEAAAVIRLWSGPVSDATETGPCIAGRQNHPDAEPERRQFTAEADLAAAAEQSEAVRYVRYVHYVHYMRYVHYMLPVKGLYISLKSSVSRS
ncbi:uncharacterized protein V6R79_011734 [Siganus canaliculatus]